jgi:hypothetical protein
VLQLLAKKGANLMSADKEGNIAGNDIYHAEELYIIG